MTSDTTTQPSVSVHCRRIAERARAAGIDAVIAKGGALLLLDAVPAGARNVGDLDVLVPKGEARALQAALIDGGWIESDLPESGHQLPILGHRSGVAVEVHTALPGVRFGTGDATAEEVIVAFVEDKHLMHVRLCVAEQCAGQQRDR